MTPLDGVVQSTSHVGPMVTNQAYIDTVLRHHNVHRANHSGRFDFMAPYIYQLY